MLNDVGILLLAGLVGFLFFGHKLSERTQGGIHKGFMWFMGLGLIAVVLGTCIESVGRNQGSDFEQQYPR
jgi:cytochrome bd-type quinol oxidase subunit 1